MQLQPAASVRRLLHPAPLHVQDCDSVCACRERNDGLYRPSTYLLFKMVEEMTVFFFLSLVTTSIVFAPCRLGGSFLLFWLVLPVCRLLGDRVWRSGVGHHWPVDRQRPENRYPSPPALLAAGRQWAL